MLRLSYISVRDANKRSVVNIELSSVKLIALILHVLCIYN